MTPLELLAALHAAGVAPRDEGFRLVAPARLVPEDLRAPLLALAPGVRAALTGWRWEGRRGRTGPPLILQVSEPLPAGVTWTRVVDDPAWTPVPAWAVSTDDGPAPALTPPVYAEPITPW